MLENIRSLQNTNRLADDLKFKIWVESGGGGKLQFYVSYVKEVQMRKIIRMKFT